MTKLAISLLMLAGGAELFAHPMGNFSINHYAAIRIGPHAIEVRYLVDMAEIPTFQEIQQNGIAPKSGDPGLAVYLAREGEALKSGVRIELNGRRLELERVSEEVIFPPGAGGLPTMKMGFVYRAGLDLSLTGVVHLHYRDDNFPGRAGWKEIVASASQGVSLAGSSVAVKDRSAELSNYPTDLLNSPPQDLEAEVNFLCSSPVTIQASDSNARKLPRANRLPAKLVHSPAAALERQTANRDVAGDQRQRVSPRDLRYPDPNSASLQLQANRQGTPRNAFTELVGRKEWGFWFLFTAALIAAGLGAFHALEPGHGKTIVAAYLVGSQGTAAHACLLGLIVTASHTAGVYLLGAVTLYASRYVVPERLYPWMAVVSGLTIAGLGIYLLIQRYRGKEHPHSHAHHHGDPHAHHHHGHAHAQTDNHDAHSNHIHKNSGTVSRRQLLALGVTGGIIPCPAALVVLLSAVALHRIAFGLFLILAFSVGLAAVLIAIGLLMVYARRFMSHMQGEGPLITRWLPLTSAAFITLLGCAITCRALTTSGIVPFRI